jgi:hypothetical protein
MTHDFCVSWGRPRELVVDIGDLVSHIGFPIAGLASDFVKPNEMESDGIPEVAGESML